jgi:hypothetical protein
MKAKIVCSTAIAVFSCLTATIAYQPARAQEPSLEETMAWIESTYNDHSEAGGASGHGFYFPTPIKAGYDSANLQSFAHDSCAITMRTKTTTRDDNYQYGKPTDSNVYIHIFNLKDIDPTSVRLFCPNNWSSYCQENAVVFGTTDRRQLITKTPIDPKGKQPQYGLIAHDSSDGFISDDYDYAFSLVKAFRHAVELCGGKPSVF